LIRADLRDRLEQTRGGPRRGVDRVRTRLVLIAQTAIAAGVAWEIALLLQPRPYFAPIAAVIALSASAGQHLRRAVELSFGVAVGILVADLLLSLVGTSGITVAVVVAAAMAAALLFGASVILVNQAAVSAVLLATLGTPQGSSSFTRFFSALIGCAVAVLVGPVVTRRDPLRMVGREAEKVLDRLATSLDEIADALAAGDPDAARAALETARSADGEIDAYQDAVAAADESLRLRPPQRRDLPKLGVYSDALQQVDFAIRNTRVLARAAETAVVRGVPAEPELCAAIRLLARAVRALGEDLHEPSEDSEARRLAREAAAEATAVLDRRTDLSANLIVAQIRSTAADILRSSGMDTRELRAALGPYPGAEA
jgi:uncharacterized membrane protein YgaE (UPF0421/DUF939 family)